MIANRLIFLVRFCDLGVQIRPVSAITCYRTSVLIWWMMMLVLIVDLESWAEISETVTKHTLTLTFSPQNWTSNHFEPHHSFQNWSTNPGEPQKFQLNLTQCWVPGWIAVLFVILQMRNFPTFVIKCCPPPLSNPHAYCPPTQLFLLTPPPCIPFIGEFRGSFATVNEAGSRIKRGEKASEI